MAAVAVWAAYVIVPNGAGGWIDGIPIGPIETSALLMLAWLAVRRAAIPGAAVIAVALATTWAAAAAIPGSGGFRARYYANDAASGEHERSTEFRGAAFTRIDTRIDFIPGRRDFPLAFFNDTGRFNFFLGHQPHRHRLGFSVRWSGLWWADGQRELYLDAPDAHAHIAIDGMDFLEAGPGSGTITRGTTLSPGWHRLDIVFRAPYGSPRRFGAGEVRDRRPRPFDESTIVTQQIRPWQLHIYRALRTTKIAIDAAALLWLAWIFISDVVRAVRRAVRAPGWPALDTALAIVAVAGAIEALIFAWPWSTRLLVMVGGDDPMTYEWYSRDILLNGVLMNGGAPPGQGEPFYYQAFYPYFLAATHAIFGEGMFGVLFLQRFFGTVLAITLTIMATRLAGMRVWAAALVTSLAFVWWKFRPIANDLLSESLYVPLLAMATLATIVAAQRPSASRAAMAGMLTGTATITRSTLLLGWPAVILAASTAWRATRNRWRLATILLGLMLGMFSLIGIRNWIVAHRFVPASTEFGVTLLGGNIPPDELTITGSPRAGVYRRLGLEESTARVVEYAVTQPGPFSANMARKALFALGIYEPYAEGWGSSPVYIIVWTTAVAGVVIGRHSAPPLAVFLLPALIALSQYAAVVVVYPKGERLILPIHTLLVPYSAIAAAALARRYAARRGAN